MITTNEDIKRIVDKHLTTKPSLVRYCYVIQHKEKYLITKTEDATFPLITFGNKWQFLCDSYYYCDLYDSDIVSLISNVLYQSININIPSEDIKPVGIDEFTAAVEYYDEQLHFYPPSSEKNKSTAHFLNLFFYANVENIEMFNLWTEFHSEYKWVDKNDLFEMNEIDIDKKFIMETFFNVFKI